MTAKDRHKPIAVLGMSGVGKTRISALLRKQAGWFHYSVDYRIGTRYLGEAIVDEFKREAMKAPMLRDMLLSDSIYISSNITFDNLAPLSAWLGKPGSTSKGGIAFDEYVRRQREHRAAEIAAMRDTALFIDKARSIYGYENFICDTSGSICEVADPDDNSDPVLSALASACRIVYVEGDEAHAAALKERFARAPKPMYYNEDFLRRIWADYCGAKSVDAYDVDPDDFIRWGFAQLIDWRAPRYKAIADKWGQTISARDVEAVKTPDEFFRLLAE